MVEQSAAPRAKSSAISSVRSYIELPLVYNHWYVAGLDEEFGITPKDKLLLERSIVFYRTASGELVAMQNRCLHRSFPLSSGTIRGDNLVCGYHGIEYAPDGQIVHVPCQDRVPTRRLRTYPLRKIGPYIFIWMGETMDADYSKLPVLDFLDDPAYGTIHGVEHLDGSYLLLMENLNDLSHFTFLHANTFKMGDHYLKLPVEVGHTDEGVFCHRMDTVWERLKGEYTAETQERVGGRSVLNLNGGVSLSPGVWKGYSPLFVKNDSGETDFKLSFYIIHYVTPETRHSAHYWWSVSRDYDNNDKTRDAMSYELFRQAFEEDICAIKKMQNLLKSDQGEFDEMLIAGDQAGMLFRQAMMKWVLEEYPDLRR
jgi:phenylpropionate dioxygenase-like ring-hydroxylating dioxygenase large terminal subunit